MTFIETAEDTLNDSERYSGPKKYSNVIPFQNKQAVEQNSALMENSYRVSQPTVPHHFRMGLSLRRLVRWYALWRSTKYSSRLSQFCG